MSRRIDERARLLEPKIAGALRSTIEAHGPVTPRLVGPATKRIAHQLAAEGLGETADSLNMLAMEAIVKVLLK